jgi:uncharacterized protein YceK
LDDGQPAKQYWPGGSGNKEKFSFMTKISLRVATLALAAAFTLSGCATVKSVHRAQSAADAAMAQGREGTEGAKRAQGSADAAAAAAQRAQGTADNAYASAQGAAGAAQGVASAQQVTAGKVAALESRLRKLEKWKWAHTHAKKHHHKAKKAK